MFDVFKQMFIQLLDCFPVCFLLYLTFDLVGSLLFNKK